jgi:hypothetical protein
VSQDTWHGCMGGTYVRPECTLVQRFAVNDIFWLRLVQPRTISRERDGAHLRNIKRVTRPVKALLGELDLALVLHTAQCEDSSAADGGCDERARDVELVLGHVCVCRKARILVQLQQFSREEGRGVNDFLCVADSPFVRLALSSQYVKIRLRMGENV